jgi:hypothetical protein
MTQRRVWGYLVAAAAAWGVTGCAPKLTMEDMKQMQPQRPVELDRLNAWVGTWHATGTMEIAGMDEPIEFSGTNTTGWDLDGWVLVEHGDFTMADMPPHKGVGVWSYDAKSGKYRSTWSDNGGSTGYGTARYMEKSDTWTMRMRGYGPMGSTVGKGSVKFVDANTMEWSWQEWPAWDLFGLFKFMKIKGTSTKQG